MRITIVTGFFLPVPPVRGGSTEKIWHRLAQLLAEAGHDITFVSRGWSGLPDRETEHGVSHIRIRGANHRRSLATNLWNDFWWGTRVARVLPTADVVICNTVTLPVWLRRIKPNAGRVVAVIARMPKGHGYAYGNIDLLLALTEVVAARLRAENAALAPRIATFPYPIDWSLHANISRQASAVATIGYVGRIHPTKGIATLLDAATRLVTRENLPRWDIELVGPWSVAEGGGGDGYRAELLARFGANLGDRVRFTGPEFDAEKLAQRYAAMEIFCYPSVDRGETFGVAVAEAMAAGCAPVVSDLECFRELVQPGETGLTFARNDRDAGVQLASALESLLLNPSYRDAVAARARTHAQRYDFSASAAQLIRLLESVASTTATRT